MPVKSLRELHGNEDFQGLPPEEQLKVFETIAPSDSDYQALPPVEQTKVRRAILGGLPKAIENQQFGEALAPELYTGEPEILGRLRGRATKMAQEVNQGLIAGAQALPREPGILARAIPRMAMEALSGRDPFTSSPEGMEFAEQGQALGAGGMAIARSATGPTGLVGREFAGEMVEQVKAAGVPVPESVQMSIEDAGEMGGALGQMSGMKATGRAARALGMEMPPELPPGAAWAETGGRVPRGYIPERVFNQPGQVEGLVPRQPTAMEQVAAAGETGFVPREAAPRTVPPPTPVQQALEATVRENPRRVAPVPEDARAQVVPPPQKSPEQIAQEAYQQGKMDQLNAQLAELDLRTRHLVKGARTAPESVMPGPLRSEAGGAPPVAGRGVRPPPQPELPAAPSALESAPVQRPPVPETGTVVPETGTAQARANQLLEGFGEVPPELQAEIDRLGPAPAGKEYIYRFEGPTQTKGGEWFTTDPGEAASYARTPEARGAGRIRISVVDSERLDAINRQLGREPSMRGEFQLPYGGRKGFVGELQGAQESANQTLTRLVGDTTDLPPSLRARGQAALEELTRMRDAGEIEKAAGVPLKPKQMKAASEVAALILWRLARKGLKEGARLYVPFTRALAAEFPELKPHAKALYDAGKEHFFSLEAGTPGGIITFDDAKELAELGRMMGGEQWYTRGVEPVRAEIERIYGAERGLQLVRLAAAISQRTSTGVTAREAIHTLDAAIAGRKFPELSGPARKQKAMKRDQLLREGIVTGPKLSDFDENLVAGWEGRRPPKATIDTLQSKITGFPVGEERQLRAAERRFAKGKEEAIAKELEMTPGEAQAAQWVPARHFGLGQIPVEKAPTELSFWEELYDHLERSGKMPEGRFDYNRIVKLHRETDGATFHPKYGSLAGADAYAVSIFPDQTQILTHPPSAAELLRYRIAKNGLIRSDPQISIGTWHDKETGKHYLDLVVTPKDRVEAIHLAEQYGQKAIFDLKNMKEIRTFSEREIPASELPPPAERMAQFRAAEKEGGRVRLRHFGPEPLEEVTTEHFGEGALSAAEKRRGATPAIHGYLGSETPPEPEVLARSQYINEVELPKGAKLYDIGKDPEGLLKQAGGDVTAVEEILKGRGEGMVNTQMGDAVYNSIVKWFGSRPVVFRQKIDEALRKQFADLLAQRAGRKGTVMGTLGGGAQDFAEDLPHIAAIGALKIARGATDAATFAAEMAKEFPQYKDQIDEIFRASRQLFVHTVTVGKQTSAELPKGELPKYAASVNIGRVSAAASEEDIARRIAQLGEVIQKKGPIKRSEIEEAAYRLGFSIEDAEKFANQTEAQRAKFLATRDVHDAYTRSWLEARDAYLSEGTRESAAKFSDATKMQIRSFRAASTVAGEAGRALGSFNITTQPLVSTRAMKAVNQLLDQLEKKHGPLWQEAIDRLALVDFEDPASVQAFVNYAHPYTTRFRDWFYEAWVSSILSGPATHMANIIGNTAFLGLRPVERGITAGVEAVRAAVSKTPREHFGGEVAADVVGIVGGIGDATRAFWKAVKTGVSTENIGKLEHAPAIPGRTGAIIRTPLTLLGAADDFFKILARRGERYANAYKAAAKGGLKGKELGEETARLVRNPTEDMLIRENQEALYRTFQTRVGKFGRAAYSLREAAEPAKYIAPFIRTPINIAKAGLERTGPLNLIKIAQLAKNGQLPRELVSPEIAKAVLGTAVAASVVPLVTSGQVTGGGPVDPERRKAWMAGGLHQPYSIKVGDTWHSYRRIEPFATMIGTVADFVELGEKGITDQKAGEVALKLAKAITVNLTSKTWLEGLNNFFDAMDDPGRYGERLVGRLVSGVVPNVVAQYERAGDVRRDVRSIRDFVTERIPGLRQKLPAVRDIRGRELPVPEGTRAERFISPLPRMRDKSDPIDQLLYEVSADISPLQRRLTVQGQSVELNPTQYEELVKLSGDLTDEYLRGVYPTLEGLPRNLQRARVRGAVQKARTLARTVYLYELHPDDILLPAIESAIDAFSEPGAPVPPLEPEE